MTKRRRPNQDASLPFVGIWWDDGRQCIAVMQPASAIPNAGDVVDSDLKHADVWPSIAGRFGMAKDEEYFNVRRGRVLYCRSVGQAIVYHGYKAGSPWLARLPVVAAEFRLRSWRPQFDDHYRFGADVDEVFDDEFGV